MMSILRLFAILVCVSAVDHIYGQDALPTRSELAELLDSAEQSRSWFSARFSKTYEYDAGDTPAGTFTENLVAIADGVGRFRVRKADSSEVKHRTEGSYEIWAWDRTEFRVFGQTIVDGNSSLPYVSIGEDFPTYLITDCDLWSVLGLMLDFPVSSKTPITRVSEVLQDTNLPAEISEVYEDGQAFVRIVLAKPFGLHVESDLYFILYYDPSRDWLLTRFIMSTSKPESEDYDNRYHNEMRVIESEEIDGVWIPILVKDNQVFYGDPEPKDHIATIRLTDIVMRPEYLESDFTIEVKSLPEGASVVDSRTGISYKIGDTMIYMDGHLNDVGEPIVSEVTSSELVRLMKDAVPMIDPVATEKLSQLEDVTFKGVMSQYSTWGFAIIGLGLASFGFLLWRRNQV